MTRYRATLAYDGTRYAGFQRQATGIVTVQGCIESALNAILRQTVTVIGAGRTDAGVHALGQVVAFDAEWRHSDVALLKALNANLPDDIALQDMQQQAGFHPRYDAQARRYRYDVLEAQVRQPTQLAYTWQVLRHQPLKVAAMQTAANLLIGEHDFAAFGKPPDVNSTNTVRRVDVSSWQTTQLMRGRLHSYSIEATAFLQHMVRRIVALLMMVGTGAMSLPDFERAFRLARLQGGTPLAPPQGLYLVAVRYREED
jgi:tRNA pseudouridine38-40 synthase